jgi:hypothetical protein
MFMWFCPPCPELVFQPLERARRILLLEVGVAGAELEMTVEAVPGSGREPTKIPLLMVVGLAVGLKQLACRTLTSWRSCARLSELQVSSLPASAFATR